MLVLLGLSGLVRADGAAFRELDKNGNGHLSQQEFQANDLDAQMFNRADTNGDKQVGPDEFAKFIANMQLQHKRPGSGPNPPRG